MRQLLAHRVFSVIAVLTLALGIGATTAFFSVVDGILFRPLPFPEADELVVVWSDVTERGGPDTEWLSWANARDIRDQTAALDGLAAWGGWGPSWTDPSEPIQMTGAFVSEGMFDQVLQTDAALGRTLLAEDHLPGAPPRLLLSHDFWSNSLGADPEVLGTVLNLSGNAFEVVGVMPQGFRPPFVPDAAFWTAYTPGETVDQLRGNFSWRTVGRTVDGGRDRIDAELIGLSDRLERSFPESNTGMSFRAVPLQRDMVSGARAGLLALLGAVVVVLLAAVVNVANLMLVRASRRTTELSVRAAIGAGRGRLVRQLVTESLVLAAVGGTVGLLFAWVGTDLLVSLAPPETPRLDEVALSGRVLLVSAVTTLGAGLVFGTLPSLRIASGDLQAGLREGSRAGEGAGGRRLRSGLVVGQVALAMVVLVGAGLLVQSFRNLRSADLGFEAEGLVTMRFNLSGPSYPDVESIQAFLFSLEDRLGSLPQVQGMTLATTVPLAGFNGDVSLMVEGRPPAADGEGLATWYRPVGDGYLSLLGIEVVEGRGIQSTDDADSPRIVVINQAMADQVFPGEDPIGQRINFNDPADPLWREIVGIAENVQQFGIREPARIATYVPLRQSASRGYMAVFKTEGDVASVASAVRRSVRELDGSIAVGAPQRVEDLVDAEVAADRFVTFLVGLFASLALVLTLVGLYGVVSFTVAARFRELGLRMALGAEPSRIARLILGRSLALVGMGLTLGVVVALAAGRVLESILFGIGTGDPLTLITASLGLLATAAVAASVPAWRAARVDPSVALRTD